MMNRFIKLIGLKLVMLFTVTLAHAQTPEKQVHHREQLWFGYLNQTRFSNKWGLWTEIQHRMTDNFADRPLLFMIRPAAAYYINDNLRIHAGYAFIHHYPVKGLNTSRTEHRPWQQIWWNQKYSGFTTLQWLRLEQRFNEKVVNDVKEDGYNYNFRVRYNFSFFVPLKGKEMAPKVPFAALINEVFLNFGDKVVYNTFDQNRLFAGFGYPFTQHVNVQLGYMNVYQQEGVGNKYFSTHAVRLFLFHTIDVRNKD